MVVEIENYHTLSGMLNWWKEETVISSQKEAIGIGIDSSVEIFLNDLISFSPLSSSSTVSKNDQIYINIIR